MRDTAFHRTNMLAKQVLKEVRSVQDNISEALDVTKFNGEDKENDPPTPTEGKQCRH